MTVPLSELGPAVQAEADRILATIPHDDAAIMLARIARYVGVEIGSDIKFFTTQIPLRVQAAVKSAAHWDRECEQTRIKIHGRP